MVNGAVENAVEVVLECGRKRVFAAAVGWPGWCRSGRDDEAAIEALADYAVRYAPVAALAGVPFDPVRSGGVPAAGFTVVERVAGNATTDFGAPDVATDHDRLPLTGERAARQAALVAASWRLLDDVVAGAPAELRKGPRGGGRDRDAIVQHVVKAEAAYARKMGVRHRTPPPGDRAAVDALRAAIVDVLRAGTGAPAPPWPLAYAARRIAWHALDHAWEIEDKSGPG